MMNKAKILAGVLAVSAVMGMTACGNDASSSSKSGTVSLVTTTTTAAESSSEETTTTTTAEETTTTTEETTTTAEQTTTTAEQTTTTAEETTTAAKETEKETTTTEEKKEESFADKLKILYGDKEVYVGESQADVESSLGAPTDKTQSAHCIGEGMDDIYWYNGLNVNIFDGKVTSLELMDNCFIGKYEINTSSGINLNCNAADIKEKLGEPVLEDDTGIYFSKDGMYAYAMADDSGCTYLIITDVKEAIPGMP